MCWPITLFQNLPTCDCVLAFKICQIDAIRLLMLEAFGGINVLRARLTCPNDRYRPNPIRNATNKRKMSIHYVDTFRRRVFRRFLRRICFGIDPDFSLIRPKKFRGHHLFYSAAVQSSAMSRICNKIFTILFFLSNILTPFKAHGPIW
jgi:hypothetical protein